LISQVEDGSIQPGVEMEFTVADVGLEDYFQHLAIRDMLPEILEDMPRGKGYLRNIEYFTGESDERHPSGSILLEGERRNGVQYASPSELDFKRVIGYSICGDNFPPKS